MIKVDNGYLSIDKIEAIYIVNSYKKSICIEYSNKNSILTIDDNVSPEDKLEEIVKLIKGKRHVE